MSSWGHPRNPCLMVNRLDLLITWSGLGDCRAGGICRYPVRSEELPMSYRARSTGLYRVRYVMLVDCDMWEPLVVPRIAPHVVLSLSWCWRAVIMQVGETRFLALILGIFSGARLTCPGIWTRRYDTVHLSPASSRFSRSVKVMFPTSYL